MTKPYNFTEDGLILKSSLSKIVVTIFIIVVIIIISKFKFSIYQQNVLLHDNNNYLIMADLDMINTLSTAKKIVINNKSYGFKMAGVGDYSNVNGNIYQSIYLDIENYNSDIKMIKCYFLKNRRTLLDSIIKFMQGG